ncbi:MAG: O-antigen ligase family protein [Bacteroidales bacterium]|nr:O-antigen ligase family protein [Bacteroidales bacterium]
MHNRSTQYSATAITVFVVLLFLAASLFAASRQMYLMWSLPLILMLVIIAFVRLDAFYLIMLFFVPLSLQLRFIMDDPPADIFLPTEPMLILLLFILFFKIVASRELNLNSFNNPVTIIVAVMLLWMLITSLASSMPMVSIKMTAARLWFIGGFYMMAIPLFVRRNFMERAFKVLIAGMVPVVIYNMNGLSQAGMFNQQAAHSTMWPLFNDHTSFGAALAFLIPLSLWLTFTRRRVLTGAAWGVASVILLTGLLFSYSRAAWISMAGAAVLAVLMIFRIPWKLIIPATLSLILVVLISWSSIVSFLESNRQDSSTDLAEHIRSAANITTDASNLERINRWKAAGRMIAERPVLGWGPGTYQFVYAPYQLPAERTIISTNFGDRGNAHSEYIGAAADSGVPGALIYIALLVSVFIPGVRFTLFSINKKKRWLMIALLSGLFTYFIHGFLNNFLDTDKLSAPFWMSIAAIVVITGKRI